MQAEEDRAFKEEKNTFIDEEIYAIDQELEKLSKGNQYEIPRENRNQKTDIKTAIGLRAEDSKKLVGPAFLSPMQIKKPKRDLSKIIPSGIDKLDKRIIGFNPRELSIWSGSNGSGKSSILSQLALNSLDNNFNVAMFSGELMADRVLDWIHLQAAGKNYVRSTQYEKYYTVPGEIAHRVNKWMDQKLFIYNNDLGTDVIKVVRAIRECIEKYHISMIVIDNMMSLDLANVSGEKYEKQTSLVLALCELTKQSNVHIHFVAHPRKSLGFLRKNDISGTADITNAADNVFIVHRVNTDFKRSIKSDLGIKDDNELFGYSNVIEVCKNRDLGIADEFIGLHFESESKRFLNYTGENNRYGWEANKIGFLDVADLKDTPFGKEDD